MKKTEEERSNTTGVGESNPGAGRCSGCRFLCAVCRILCFTCIRRLCPCCFSPRPQPRTEVSILVLGLEGGGKSTLLATVAGELEAENKDPSPTMGFAFKTVNVEEHLTLNFQELGGSEQIRMYWDRYFTCKHLIVYVVDSSSSEDQMEKSRKALTSCLSSPSLSGLPLLLVCTKQDLPNTSSVAEIREKMRVQEMEEERRIAMISTSSQDLSSTRDSVIRTISDLLLTSQNPPLQSSF